MPAEGSMADETRQWLAEGIAKIKAGQRAEARELLLRVVERDERNARAWLWLSSVVDSLDDRRVALENVLALEPENAAAKAGLDWLDRQTVAPSPPMQAVLPMPESGPAHPLSEHPYIDPRPRPP